MAFSISIGRRLFVLADFLFEPGKRRHRNRARFQRAFADGDEQLFFVVLAETLGGLLQRGVGEFVAVAVQRVRDEIAAELAELLAPRVALKPALRRLWRGRSWSALRNPARARRVRR